MKPSSVINSTIKEHRQKAVKISAYIDPADEGSPARLVYSKCEAGNKKSSC
jgi:hypothetical protein